MDSAVKRRSGLPMAQAADGRFYIALPGVVHTAKVSQDALDAVPAGWISSREAAAALGLHVRSTRALLNRAGVRSVRVKQGGCAPGLFWEPEGVRRKAEEKSPPKDALPTGWCTSAEACLILGVARSSLARFCAGGALCAKKVRVRTSTGVRPMVILKRSQVRGLAALRQAGERARARLRRARDMRYRRSLYGCRVMLE